jgi:hypothetical protein
MSKSSGRSSLIGVAISLAGNVLISLALNCQKLAHVRLEKEGQEGDYEEQSVGGNDEESQRLLGEPNSSQSAGQGDYGSGRRESTSSQRTLKTNGTDGSPGAATESQEVENDSMSTTFLRSRLWWLGICLMTLGELGNFLCESESH